MDSLLGSYKEIYIYIYIYIYIRSETFENNLNSHLNPRVSIYPSGECKNTKLNVTGEDLETLVANIYIYIYIYICSHPQTDCFVVSQLFYVARHVGHFKLGSKPARLYVRLSIIPLSQLATYVSSGIIRYYVVVFVCLHFTIPDIRVLNSLKELCIMREAAVNS